MVSVTPESSEEVRKKAKNTLVASVTVLSKDGLYNLVRIIVSLVMPMYDKHSDNEAQVRGPEETRLYYNQMAKGGWKDTQLATLRLLEDIPALNRMGFSTDWSNCPKKAKEDDP
eukprot:10827994-Lingulodinium_polyedra.AAC.1